MLASELFESQKICPVCGCTPCNCTHIVKEDFDWREASAKSNLQPGVPVMIWLGPRNQNPPRDDKKWWERGVVMDSPEWIDGAWRVLVKTDTKSQWPINPERVFVLKQGVVEGRDNPLQDIDPNGWHLIQGDKPIAINFPNEYRAKSFHSGHGYGRETKVLHGSQVRRNAYLKYNPRVINWPEYSQGVAEDSDPCWKGYKQIGMKKKSGKQVPNCVPEGTEVVPAANPEDTVSLDIPLLIRLLEYSREDAKTDMDLHNVAERLITLSAGGRTLSMNDYDTIIPGSSD